MKICAGDARQLLDQHHFQNFVGGTHFGAYYDNKLIGAMTFGKSRNGNLELKRFVTDPASSYPGLFSKILKFAQNEMKFTKLISFSDNRWFTGNMYEKAGFTFAKDIMPSYAYSYKNKIMHKQSFTKQQILQKFPETKILIEEGMTEKQLMVHLGIPRIYDCGKKEWHITFP
jgi:hypothetical protein